MSKYDDIRQIIEEKAKNGEINDKEKETLLDKVDDKENENLPSTVVLCLEDGYKILRQGALEL